jgi:phosphoglycolate phosphatase-like HAD superfamily hydrolase
MNVKQLLEEELNTLKESVTDKRTNDKIIIFDIDNTLVVAKDIFIHLKEKATGKDVKKFTPEQYDGMTKDQKNKLLEGGKYEFDFREFRDPKKIYDSIIAGTPKIPVLKVLDRHVKAGWHVGVVTARGAEDSVRDAIRDWLKTNVGGKLVSVPNLKRENVHAINDDAKRAAGVYKGYNKNPSLEKFLAKYKVVKFVDDSHEHLANAKKIKVPSGKVLKTIDANRDR